MECPALAKKVIVVCLRPCALVCLMPAFFANKEIILENSCGFFAAIGNKLAVFSIEKPNSFAFEFHCTSLAAIKEDTSTKPLEPHLADC